jgi:diacylglycerol O-acyltransferase
VIMAVVDDALQHYLRGHGRGTDQALVSAMAFSTRSDAHGSSGNQVGADLVSLGDPGAPIAKRLQQVHAATTGVKEKAQQMPLALRQLNSLLLFGAATIPNLPGMVKPAPTYNLLMSNMVGPRDRLYLGGAPLVGMLGLPIVPPNPGLNVTFVSLYDQICLAVGATPNTMPDPENFIELLKASFAELEQTLAPDQPVAKKAPRKKTGATRAAKKSAARKRSPARKTRNNKAAAAES